MTTIELRDIRLTAFHGIFEGEQKTGNPYLIDLLVKYDERNSDFSDINGTINYADLYAIVKNTMQIPEGLLEKVCDKIIRRIRHNYAFIREVEISITKLQPPIEGLQGKVGVRMNRMFNE